MIISWHSKSCNIKHQRLETPIITDRKQSRDTEKKIQDIGNLNNLARATSAWSKFLLQPIELTGIKNEGDISALL